MTPKEAAILRALGNTVEIDGGMTVACCILYGLYITLVFMALSNLYKRKSQSRSIWMLFAFLLVMAALVTADICLRIAMFFKLLIIPSLLDDPSISLQDRSVQVFNAAAFLGKVKLWFSGEFIGLIFLVGDAVLVMRTCLLWSPQTHPRSKAICRWIAIFFLSCNLISTILIQIFIDVKQPTVGTGDASAVAITFKSDSYQTAIFFLVPATSLCTNVFTTCLLAYQAWWTQRYRRAFGMTMSRSAAIMLLLTRSGFTFCILQIVNVVLYLIYVLHQSILNRNFVLWWLLILEFITAFYPAWLILMVSHRDSHRRWEDTLEVCKHNSPQRPDSLPVLDIKRHGLSGTIVTCPEP